MNQKRCRADSRPSVALRALLAETARLGHAITLVELRAVLARDGAIVDRLDVVLNQLRRRGLIRRVAGRNRSTQYCAESAPVPAKSVEEPYEVLESIVRTHCERTGEAVLLGSIRGAMASAGLQRTGDQLRSMLEILCVASPRRSTPEQCAARLEVAPVEGDFQLKDRCCWRPVGSAYPAPAAGAPSRAGALRQLVASTTLATGLPAALSETKLWLALPEQASLRAALGRAGAGGGTFANAMRTTAGADARRDASGALVTASAPFACDGGAPLRLWVRGVDCDDLAARLVDASYWLMPEAELASCERLLLEAEALELRALAELAAVRRAATITSLLSYVGLSPNRRSWGQTRENITRATATVRRWWEAQRPTKYAAPARAVQMLEGAMESMRCLDEHPDLLPAPNTVTMAGARGLVAAATAGEWFCEILRPQGRDIQHPNGYLAGARRFPNPARERGPLYDDEHTPLSLVDVGDVLARAAQVTTDATLSVILASASEVLGSAVRDPDVLLHALRELPRDESDYRDGLIVALGALDALPPPDATGYDPVPLRDAYVVALGVSPLTPEQRVNALQPFRSFGPGTWDVELDEVESRFLEGSCLTAAM